MKPRFAPRLDILPSPQRALWNELGSLPDEFTLYGGTAVALHLGHRCSIDFDFFGTQAFDPGQLHGTIRFLRDAKVIQQQPNTLTCLVDQGGPVKVSFFGLPHLHPVLPAVIADDNGLRVASLLDLAGTKAAVVQRRAEAKDYTDLDAIMSAGIGLPLALSAASSMYGPSFNPQLTLKALSYFGDGDLATLPDALKERITHAVTKTDLDRLPTLPDNGGTGILP